MLHIVSIVYFLFVISNGHSVWQGSIWNTRYKLPFPIARLRPPQRASVVLNRLSIGHTRLTHSLPPLRWWHTWMW